MTYSAIEGVPAADVPLHYDRIWALLEKCAVRSTGRKSARDLYDDCRTGNKQLWVVGHYQAILLTHVGDDYVSIDFCAGTGRLQWQEAIDAEICGWARHLGKKRVFALGRPGWDSFSKSAGYREINREYVKDV